MKNTTTLIPLNIPTSTENERKNVIRFFENSSIQENGEFSEMCLEWLTTHFGHSRILLTKSCTDALEMASILLNISPGDEVIMPSFNFVSPANSMVLRGAIPVFVDIHSVSMNINEDLIEAAITPRTKAILVIHYAGVSCNMERLTEISKKYGLALIEDSAHGILSYYNDLPLGTFGDIGVLSFDKMKNITCGQGGLIVINREDLWEKAEIIFENGTNKKSYSRGDSPFYEWFGLGSNFSMPEIQAAILSGQLCLAQEITKDRLRIWNLYATSLQPLENDGNIQLPKIPDQAKHNAHIFFIKTKNIHERQFLIDFLLKRGVMATFHYIPLHSTEYGKSVSRFSGEDVFTTSESERLLRLPLYTSLKLDEAAKIISLIKDFYATQ